MTPLPEHVFRFLIPTLLLSLCASDPSEAQPMSPENETETTAIAERADAILASLAIDDETRHALARQILVRHDHKLRAIHAALAEKLASADGPGDPAVAAAWSGVVRGRAQTELFELQRRFLASLSALLTPDQVNLVKDGMTRGAVPAIYDRYVQQLPALTEEQKFVIMAQLLEAREYAMETLSPEEQQAWFKQYQSRIHDFLSQAGYDVRELERELAKRDEEKL